MHSNINPVVKEDYPCLKQFDDGSAVVMIVLFKEPCTGTVVYANKHSVWPVSDFSNNWIMENFKPFYGQIILEE